MTKKKNIETGADEIVEGEMTFMQHLESLRWHLVRSVIAIVIAGILCFLVSDFIFDEIILKPKMPTFWTNRMFAKFAELISTPSLAINNEVLNIISINMAGQFSMHIQMSLVAGVIISFPYLLKEAWGFIEPALRSEEKRGATSTIFGGSFLFALGILFGYYIIAPLSIHFLGGYSVSSEVVNQITLTSYISTILSVVIASGIVFELPIIVYFLSKLGLLTPELMKKYRKHAIVGLLLLSAIITPPDVYSQILVCIPLIILYEVSIAISARITRDNEKEWDSDLDSDNLEI